MTLPDHHARVTALFHEALTHDTDVRAAWLAAHCDDPAVRREITAMLTHHAGAETGLLDRSLFAPRGGGGADGMAPDPLLGQAIGAWRVTGLLGRGGMGAVYRAERADDAFRQHAALKLVHPGFVADFRPRFLRERALLAGLDHPGIARLLDGGMADDGTPFLAMELVEGAPITDYAEQRGLSVRARLALFVEACEAVAYAHRSLVVHRDLKPNHIVVTEDPGSGPGQAGALRVKLLDFGVAKLLEDDGADVLTRTGAGPMTPAYAAPEQLLGRPVTTATDVYALGVVLYELLAGRRPYDLRTLTAAQTERLVSEQIPAAPSTVAGAPVRALKGDLDTIVMKALAKTPERRYASADALAADLRRHLNGLPIEARPATAGYRLGLFVRRHRVSVAVATAFALGALLLVSFYTVRLRAERDRATEASHVAREETERAEAVAGFLEGILRAPNQRWYNDAEATGPDTPIRAVLDEAARRVDYDFAGRPDLAADLHHILGDTYLAIGLASEARRHHRRTLVLRESLYTAPDPRIAEALYYLAGISPQEGPDGQLPLMERAVAMQRARNEGNNFPFSVLDLAGLYIETGRYAEAAPLLAEGIAFVERRFVPGDDGFRYRDRMLAYLAQSRTRALVPLGDLEEAARQLAFADSVLARLPRLAVNYEMWRSQMCALGTLRLGQRRYGEAEPAFLACYGEGPPRAPASPFPRQTLLTISGDLLQGIASRGLAALYEAQGRHEAAAPYHAETARLLARWDSLRAASAAD